MLGVWANAFTLDTFSATIHHAIDTRIRCIIGHHNLHSIYLYHRVAWMRAFFDLADYAFIDGMPLIWWGRLMGYPLRRHHRFTSVDWLPLLVQRSAEAGWRIGYLGGRPGIAERGADILRRQYPGLQIDTRHGFFDIESPAVNASIIDMVNAWQPDILLVGMGMPRQERWILAHQERLNAPCILPVGAALDYWAGVIPIPPRVVGRLGLEWLARLIAEPRRLWRRYLLEPWFLLPNMAHDMRQRLELKHHEDDADL